MPGHISSEITSAGAPTYPENGWVEEQREWPEEQLEEAHVRLPTIE